MNKLAFLGLICMFLGTFFIVVCYNTIDQMIIRYKYYDDWRGVETWTMTYWWSPHWQDIYFVSVFGLALGGFLLGVPAAVLLKEMVK